MKYKIFPSIGFARLGQDDNFFLAPEIPGSGPVELNADGTTTPVTKFKDASKLKIRKQGVRFHIFESTDGSTWVEANLPPGSEVKWTVTLENKKSAVSRKSSPPVAPERPTVPVGNQSMIINGGTKSISGPNKASAPFVGTYSTSAQNGSNYTIDVDLGILRTDNKGKLIVLGGKGLSTAPPNTPLGPSFYRNPQWHDDVSDGPVTAEIILTPGAAPVVAEGGAWIVVAPPDYAPEINSVVTLYDVIKQVGIPIQNTTPSFDHDIAPLIQRVRRLRWVHRNPRWSDAKLDDKNLRNKTNAFQQLRADVRDLILEVQDIFAGHIASDGPPFELREHQIKMLADWVNGNFDNTPASQPKFTAEGLTRVSLESAAGQGFCPGIEAGILVLDSQIYTTPFDFRISHAVLKAGDLTALMAQPWQADFHDCETKWWPAQRPDIAHQSSGNPEFWVRGAGSQKLLLQRSSRLGFISKQGNNELFIEVERDPTL